MTDDTDQQSGPFIHRELSQLEFNHRVLMQAQDKNIPLLERLRYLFITYSNLDEFFEIRVAALKQHMQAGTHEGWMVTGTDIPDILHSISEYAHQLIEKLFTIYNEEIYSDLVKEGILFLKHHDWTAAQKKWIANYFKEEIVPVISPIGLDVAHPFPRLVNKNLNFIVSLSGKDAFGRDSGLAIVHVPRSIPRLIPVPEEIRDNGKNSFFSLTSIIKDHVEELFSGMKIEGCYQFRIIRNSDLLLDETEIQDLPLAVRTSLSESRFGDAVRLDVEANCTDDLANYLLQQQGLTENDLYRIAG